MTGALIAVADDQAVWTCPYCGESLGEPVTVHSREFQGDEAHGGIVEWSDEACTVCQCESKLLDCEYLSRADVARMMDEYRAELRSAA